MKSFILGSSKEDFNQELLDLLKEGDQNLKPDGIDAFSNLISDTLRNEIYDSKKRLLIQGKLLIYLNQLISEEES